jgi:hypothetical protein
VTFKAFDGQGNLIGTLTSTTDDGNFNGGTAEDRFFGVTNASGIGSIFLSNQSGGIEMDHLQYGIAASEESAVPEPAFAAPLCLALLFLVVVCRRNRLCGEPLAR